MLENMPSHDRRTPQSRTRQGKALLRLIEDLGYQVDRRNTDDCVFRDIDEHGVPRIVGFSTAEEIDETARLLAEALQADEKPARTPVSTAHEWEC